MFARTVAPVNAVIQLNPNVPMSVAEAGRLSGVPHAVAKSALHTLVERGLIVETERMDKLVYAPNPRSPHAAGARMAALIDLPWEGCLRAGGINPSGIAAIYVYGSQARGTAAPTSDIDVLVIGAADKNAIFSAFVPIETMTGRHVDPWVMRSAEASDRLAAGDSYIKSALAGLRVFGEADFA
jgi:hypothetical protein